MGGFGSGVRRDADRHEDLHVGGPGQGMRHLHPEQLGAARPVCLGRELGPGEGVFHQPHPDQGGDQVGGTGHLAEVFADSAHSLLLVVAGVVGRHLADGA